MNLLSLKPVAIIGIICISVIVIFMLIGEKKKDPVISQKSVLHIGEALHNIGELYKRLCINLFEMNWKSIESYCTPSLVDKLKNSNFINLKIPLTIVNVKFISQNKNIISTEVISFTSIGEYLINNVTVIHNENITLINEVN